MPETGTDQTLMALLALEAEDSPAELDAAASGAPTFAQRIELYLNAVYGRDAVVTDAMREAAREHLLAAMAADLAEETGAAPVRDDAVASVRHGVAAQAGGGAAAASSPILAGLERAIAQLAAAVAELFSVRGMRMVAVPLVALLVVGSVWTRDWLHEHGVNGGSDSQIVPGGSAPGGDGTSTRSLTPPSAQIDPAREQNLKRAIAAQEAAHGADDPALAQTLVQLGALYRSEGRYEAAEGLYKRALSIRRGALGAKDPATLRTLNELAAIYRLEGRGKDADDLRSQAGQ